MKQFFALFIFILFLFTACKPCIEGEGKRTEQEITLNEISTLVTRVNAKIFVTFDAKQKDASLKISTYENLLEYLSFEEENGVLTLNSSACMANTEDLVFELRCNSLSEIESNSGDITFKNELEAKKFELLITGSSDADLKLAVTHYTLRIMGSGDVEAKGEVFSQRIEIYGSGDVESEKLASEKCSIQINGSGDVNVKVKEELDVEINGSGDVHYKGKPKLSKTINGSGEVSEY